MSVERGLTAFAGFMVLLSVALTYFVHPGFVWLTVFVGANLFQQSFTGFCPAAIMFRKLGLLDDATCRVEFDNQPIAATVDGAIWPEVNNRGAEARRNRGD